MLIDPNFIKGFMHFLHIIDMKILEKPQNFSTNFLCGYDQIEGR